MDPYERIIWSADVANQIELFIQLEKMPKLRAIKIDAAFVEENGWDVFSGLRCFPNVRVFDDAKLIEIPSKLEKRAEVHCRKAQPWMLNCMAGGVSNLNFGASQGELDGLRRFADVCADAGVHSCAVSVLTSKSDMTVANEFCGRSSMDQVVFYAERLVQAGITHLVCSPKEAVMIKKMWPNELQLVTPGVRPAGNAPSDQARIATPGSAIQNGSDYLVIGRPITEGRGTPAENLDAIAAEIAAAIN